MITFEKIKNMPFKEAKSSDDSLVILDDCLSALKEIPSESIDLIFADPPYSSEKNLKNGKNKWNSIKEYRLWCNRWIDECFRVLKNDGTFYLLTDSMHMAAMDVYISDKYNVISRIIWSYSSGGAQSKKNFGSLFEPILMCSKSLDAKYTFNYQDVMIETKKSTQIRLSDYLWPSVRSNKKAPGNIWNFNRVRVNMDEYENHQDQKPESLLERIILASSNTGDIVLDPFSGSFTTSAVAIKLNRKAIGIDINPDYYKIGLRRTEVRGILNGESLEKNIIRKTKYKSKSDIDEFDYQSKKEAANMKRQMSRFFNQLMKK